MVPYKDNGHLTDRQIYFNTVLSSVRQVVERSIRLLKGRWRKLHYVDHLNMKLLVQLTMAACVLHNACLLHDDFDEGYMLDADDDNDGNGDGGGNNEVNAPQDGNNKRNRLTNEIFNNRN